MPQRNGPGLQPEGRLGGVTWDSMVPTQDSVRGAVFDGGRASSSVLHVNTLEDHTTTSARPSARKSLPVLRRLEGAPGGNTVCELRVGRVCYGAQWRSLACGESPRAEVCLRVRLGCGPARPGRRLSACARRRCCCRRSARARGAGEAFQCANVWPAGRRARSRAPEGGVRVSRGARGAGRGECAREERGAQCVCARVRGARAPQFSRTPRGGGGGAGVRVTSPRAPV